MSAEDRWNLEEFNNMEVVNAFLDNEEDKLPDVFDPTKVFKQHTDNCYLCNKTFSKLPTSLLGGR